MDAMLKALRQRGLQDVALDYLESLRNSGLIDDQAKQSIPYEEGFLLVERARGQRTTADRLATLESAQAKFEEFLTAHPDHAQSAAAANQLGNLLIERGRALRDGAENPNDKAQVKAQRAQAAGIFNEAREKLAAADTQFEQQLNALGRPAPNEEASVTARRDELRRQLLQSRLFAAQALFEAAGCDEPKGPDRKRLLEEAAKAYADIHEKYPQVLGGFYAQLWQARCLAEQRQWNQALAIYDELRQRPEDDDEFRQLRAKALLYALDCWPEIDGGRATAVEQSQVWLGQLRGAEDRSADNLEIRWRLVQSLMEDAKAATNPEDQAKLRESALAAAQFVAGAVGPRRSEARQLLASQTDRGQRAAPAKFSDARDQAQEAIDRLQTAENQLVASANDPAARAKAETDRNTAAREAADALRRQIALRGPEDSIDDLNQARHYLAFVEYQLGNPLAAATLGEFLARRYPQSPQGRGGAKIAMAAYLTEYNRLGDVDRAFEKQRLENLAHYLAETWPKEPEANEAWLTLGDLAAREHRYDDALDYFSRVAEGSAQRVQGDLAAGQIAWARYIESAQSQGESRPAPEVLQQQLADTRARLEAAVSAGRKNAGGITYTQLAAELSLAQLYAELGENGKALEVLDVEQDGVLTLVAKRHPLAERGNFPLEAQKVALRAAVGAGKLDRAQAVLKALGERAAKDPQGQAALARLYLALGRELEQQVERLQTTAKPEELSKLLASFELFLQKLSERPNEASYESLEWAADTWYRLGNGLAGGDAKSVQRSRKYLGEAGKLYTAMLKRAAEQPGFLARPEQRVVLELRSAAALRAAGRYQQALDQVLTVLKRNPNQLEAQIEAAAIYQAWGGEAPENYASAMGGAQPSRDKQGREFRLVWGWAKLANALQRLPQHAERFLEARYNLADCRYHWALTREGQDRATALTAAERDIAVTAQLRADLGGPQWNAKFDALAKSIQESAGRPVVGLGALTSSAPPSPQASNR